VVGNKDCEIEIQSQTSINTNVFVDKTNDHI